MASAVMRDSGTLENTLCHQTVLFYTSEYAKSDKSDLNASFLHLGLYVLHTC